MAKRYDGRSRRHAQPSAALVAIFDRWFRPLADELRPHLRQHAHVVLLGRSVEVVYGGKEFRDSIWCWWCLPALSGPPPTRSPARRVMWRCTGHRFITGVIVLFAFNFPRSTILLFFVLPIPAWVLGVLVVGLDISGAMGGPGMSHVAYAAHLAGAAIALVYYQQGWNFGRLLGRFRWPTFRRRPHLRVHMPQKESPPNREPVSDMGVEVDRILEKIYRDGESSLTPTERKFLETASREYQRKNKS